MLPCAMFLTLEKWDIHLIHNNKNISVQNSHVYMFIPMVLSQYIALLYSRRRGEDRTIWMFECCAAQPRKLEQGKMEGGYLGVLL